MPGRVTNTRRCWRKILRLSAEVRLTEVTVGLLNGMASAGMPPDEVGANRVLVLVSRR